MSLSSDLDDDEKAKMLGLLGSSNDQDFDPTENLDQDQDQEFDQN